MHFCWLVGFQWSYWRFSGVCQRRYQNLQRTEGLSGIQESFNGVLEKFQQVPGFLINAFAGWRGF